MCLSIPVQVLELNDDLALVATSTRQVKVGRRLLLQAKPGDWVLIHAGQMVSVIPADEAAVLQSLLDGPDPLIVADQSNQKDK